MRPIASKKPITLVWSSSTRAELLTRTCVVRKIRARKGIVPFGHAPETGLFALSLSKHSFGRGSGQSTLGNHISVSGKTRSRGLLLCSLIISRGTLSAPKSSAPMCPSWR